MNRVGLIEWLKPKTIQSYLVSMVLGLVFIQVVVSWFIISGLASDLTRHQIGQTALKTALAVAEIPQIRRALLSDDPYHVIQPLAETIRKKTGAAFVVVGDTKGVRYSHPVRERIGQHFVGGDTGPAISEGKSYVSQARGTLGVSLRGMTPVYDYNSRIIGFVSVGYLTENIRKTIPRYLNKPLLSILGMCAVGVLSAVFIAWQLKRITLGLEPAEITSLYLERGAVLESIREGVIALDDQGQVRLANKAAFRYTGIDPEILGKSRDVREVLPEAGLMRTLRTGEAEHDLERVVNGRELVFNIIPVLHADKVHGVVASFRRKDELDRLADELSRVQEYTELLRGQTHEYSNKLHTIAGLIQIGAHREALDLVTTESSGYEDIIRFLNEAVPHPVIAAIVLGKFNRARELKIDFQVDREGTMLDVPEWLPQDKLVTIVGNLIANAFDAVLQQDKDNRRVDLSFTDLGKEIIFEVSDSGPGIPQELLDRIFEKGVSTKGPGRRGLGLFLARQRTRELGGWITVAPGELGGALFTVAIPKHQKGKP